MPAYATTADLAARWRALTAAETTRAGLLLDSASRIIRQKCPTLDARIVAGTASAEDAEDVCCDMVIRVMASGDPGAGQRRVTVGGVTVDTKYAGPYGLRLTAAEFERLAPMTRAAYSVSIATPDAD